MNNLPSEEIKSRIDIVDVVSDYIKLQKSGSNFKAICPFHNENSPSFFVSPEKQIFNCFGCGKGGDMFKFVMEMEGVEFVDALRILAKKAGIELKREDPKTKTEKSELQSICTDSARYFYRNLNTDVGIEALEYLKKRGLKKETIDDFRLGYATDHWDGLFNFLTLKGYKPEMIERAGLVLCSMKSGKKRYFDRFRGRVMFPILDVNGYIVGFTGRYIKERENEGKYVNSPQTPIFDKSNILYGLEKAKTEIKKLGSVIVVEGQMDVIISHQEGIKNVVASSGTALTLNQIKLLKRYTNNIKMAFDMDSAGDMATKRGIDVAMEEEMNVSVVRIPEGKDPADFILSHGAEDLKNAFENPISIMEYYLDTVISKYDKTTLQGKKGITNEMLLHIKKIKNKVELYYWLDRLAEILNVDIKYLEDELRSLKDPVKNFQKSLKKDNNSFVKNSKKDDKFLKSILAILLKKPETLSVLKEKKFSDFLKNNTEELNEILSLELILLFDFLEKYVTMGQISEVIEKATEEQKNLLNPIILQSEIMGEINFDAEIDFCIQRITEDLKRIKIHKQNLRIKEAEREGDEKKLKELLSQLNNIINS